MEGEDYTNTLKYHPVTVSTSARNGALEMIMSKSETITPGARDILRLGTIAECSMR